MEAPNDPILWITLAVMLVGLVGSVLPGLPGVPLIFIAGLVYAIATDFEVVSGLTVGLLGLFAAVALVLDFVATAYGARRDRKSTRLNSSHANISYAVFCLKKKHQHFPHTS